jgi:hypothetical protein
MSCPSHILPSPVSRQKPVPDTYNIHSKRRDNAAVLDIESDRKYI